MRVILTKRETADGCVIGTLTVGEAYEVIGIEAGYYRIVDEASEPILFDDNCFRVVDSSEPACWVSSIEDEVRYAYPPEWMRPGFFEDYFDDRGRVRSEFWSQHARYFGPGKSGS